MNSEIYIYSDTQKLYAKEFLIIPSHTVFLYFINLFSVHYTLTPVQFLPVPLPLHEPFRPYALLSQ